MNQSDRTITARVERVVFPRPGDAAPSWPSFCIMRTDAGTVKGKLSHMPKAGERLTLDGRWEVSRYNGQPEFAFFHAKAFVPRDERAMLRYACDITKGFGPTLEGLIWERLGDRWREASASDGIPGLTPPRVEALRRTVEFIRTNSAKAEAVAWLCSMGCTLNMAEAASERWEASTVEVVQGDCYKLAGLRGYGFAEVDGRIRERFGIGRDDPRRIGACVRHYMEQLAQDDTAMLWTDLYAKVSGAIDASPGAIAGCCRAAFADGRLASFPRSMRLATASDRADEGAVWEFANSRREVAGRRARQPSGAGFRLDASQMDAVQHAVDSPFSVINGGAGCGKTTIIRAICDTLGDSVRLCAFAGKAAARLKEATGREARTIHSTLGYMGEGVGFSRKDLRGLTVVIDEASMVSSDLLAEVVRRSPERLVLVGDEAQLPPVGRGQPFHDLVALCGGAVRTLTTCYRNSEAVFAAAAAVRGGAMPCRYSRTESEVFEFRREPDQARTHGYVLDCVRGGELDFGEDAVLCCRNGGDGDRECTVAGLNEDIKAIVNPNEGGGFAVSAGDRVINTKNCADLDVWNGTTGRCTGFDAAGAMWVDLDDPTRDGERSVLVPRDRAKDWQLAYALTVHKAQGSQYRKVVFLVTRRDAATLLSRSMVYTAMTRARSECRVVGDEQTLRSAIGRVGRKHTVMQELACGG